MTEKSLSHEDRERLLRDIDAKSGNVRATQVRQWIRDSRYYTEKVAAEGDHATAEARAIFWIRIHGVLGEIHDDFAGNLEGVSSMLEGRLRPIYFDPQKKILDRINGTIALLTEEELLYLQYRRDTECHPWQDAYRLRPRKRKLKDDRTVFGKNWQIEELDTALEKILRRYAVDETAIATEFARRLSPAIDEVFRPSEAWFTMTR